MMPSPIQAYFDADKTDDLQALTGAFASHAVVRDEGKTYAGKEAIEAWWRAAKAKYQSVVEPLGLDEQNEAIKVRARVSGNFPGSPATLTFAFKLAGDRIEELEIAP
ncbi:MAG: nuclear transport factor 2 family protein [Parvibaculum sp.]|uniref:nuclear transport factor 2 family protein n=1 Tax=Parvibaculum sp. TaxID=2024848 RepID=UPI003266FE53